jgi:hypothetical protein
MKDGGMEIFRGLISYAGFGVSAATVALALWGLIAFFPRNGLRGDTAASWLILAIWLGFLGVGVHTLYWRILSDVAIWLELSTVEQSTWFGTHIVDFLWNGIAIVSVYLHFYARYKSISSDEQRIWSPLLMGFYPDLSHWAVKTSMRVQTLYRRQSKNPERT